MRDDGTDQETDRCADRRNRATNVNGTLRVEVEELTDAVVVVEARVGPSKLVFLGRIELKSSLEGPDALVRPAEGQ
jgi:hypothetical protein